ncbi:uncharacterized protein LOC115887765 [Sitophilus oryzae]|uniref:Uncharacterized protein LOC115887765 n=1 Tax=Sitophilus oryzae TaxID=7048 RepID=A0A6J2YGJ6_SITOR|nr:uncharacterized protein LOC115887765 [Sitophilus oryzae]
MMKIRVKTAALIIANRLDSMGISLAKQKTELLALVGQRKLDGWSADIMGVTIMPCKAVRYMGVWLDSGLRMTTHVRRIVEKTTPATNILSRVMPNVGGPRAMKRRTVASAVTSMILYAAPIWRRAIQYQHYQNMLQSMIRRLVLRITSAYRTALTSAVLALAGVMPIVHQVEERLQVRENILMKWQEDWQRYDGWAKQFIENVAEWTTFLLKLSQVMGVLTNT